MQKLNEVIDLMQKICNINISLEDLDALQTDISEKQDIISNIDNAKCVIQLQNLKDIINKVESKQTLSKL